MRIIVLLLLGAASVAQAQGWDDRRANVISGGFAPNAGGLGVSYRHLLQSAPVAFGIGYGVWGPGVQVQLTLATNQPFPWMSHDPGADRIFFSTSVLTFLNPSTSRYQETDIAFDVGTQAWPGMNDWLFGEIGLGLQFPISGQDDDNPFNLAVCFMFGVGF
jgi:hypothetical protein